MIDPAGPEHEAGGWLDPEPLHAAAAEGDSDAVRRLVADGWDVNAFDDLGWTPLHHAASNEHLEVAAVLLAAGADVNAHDESRISETPLGLIAAGCSLAMAKHLIEAGADPTLRIGLRRSALQQAAGRKRFDGPEVYSLFVAAALRRGHVVGNPTRRR